MDMTSIFSELFATFWFLIPLLMIAALLKSGWFKGVFGEFTVNIILKFSLPKEKYILLKNITFPTEDGTTQIDHVVVSKFGVFVIETKNMKGWIFGSINQKQWTQKIFKHSNKFQNPIHQNYKHLKTLEKALSLPLKNLHSVIAFVGESTFKTKMPPNVVVPMTLIKYIKSKKEIVFTDKKVKDICEEINANKLTRGIKTDMDHINHVKEILKSKKG